jgi:hypothetical protein
MKPSSKQTARRESCENFVREHHPGMADGARIKGACPLLPLRPARRIHSGTDWWLQTDESMAALGGTYLAHLFDCREMLDHDWFIARSDQEPWALSSRALCAASDAGKDRGIASRSG